MYLSGLMENVEIYKNRNSLLIIFVLIVDEIYKQLRSIKNKQTNGNGSGSRNNIKMVASRGR